jgi:hypothetical protein
MAEKKRLFKAEMLNLAPAHAVIGDEPVRLLDQEMQNRLDLRQLKLDPALEPSVKRLIAHFKDEK